jgi:hypothetical protein
MRVGTPGAGQQLREMSYSNSLNTMKPRLRTNVISFLELARIGSLHFILVDSPSD